VVLTIVRQPNIQSDAGHIRRKFLSPVKIGQRRRPLFPAHVDDTQVRVRTRDLRVENHDLFKIVFRLFKVSLTECFFAAPEDLLRIRYRTDGRGFLLASIGSLKTCAQCTHGRPDQQQGHDNRDQKSSDS